MTRQDKIVDRLVRRPPPTDLGWREFVTTMAAPGFELHENGGGSSHKYLVGEVNGITRVVNICRPHPDVMMKAYPIRAVVAKMMDWGLL